MGWLAVPRDEEDLTRFWGVDATSAAALAARFFL
jgi:hypothetical protein